MKHITHEYNLVYSKDIMMKTIKLPKDLNDLPKCLPGSAYESQI